MSDDQCVLIDCGRSDWFDVRDMRVHGPLTESHAFAYAKAINELHLERRDSDGDVKAWVMPLTPPLSDPYDFKIA